MTRPLSSTTMLNSYVELLHSIHEHERLDKEKKKELRKKLKNKIINFKDIKELNRL